MKRILVLVSLLAIAGFSGCKSEEEDTHASHGHEKAGECSCALGKKGETVWCERCDLGYIKGKKNKDKAAVEAAMAK